MYRLLLQYELYRSSFYSLFAYIFLNLGIFLFTKHDQLSNGNTVFQSCIYTKSDKQGIGNAVKCACTSQISICGQFTHVINRLILHFFWRETHPTLICTEVQCFLIIRGTALSITEESFYCRFLLKCKQQIRKKNELNKVAWSPFVYIF